VVYGRRTRVSRRRYEYGDKIYRLAERESEVWSVFDGASLIGTLIATPRIDERGPLYMVRLDHEGATVSESIDDWEAALDYLIDRRVPGGPVADGLPVRPRPIRAPWRRFRPIRSSRGRSSETRPGAAPHALGLGPILTKEANEQGLSGRQLARMVDVSQPEMAAYLRGEVKRRGIAGDLQRARAGPRGSHCRGF
jgi:hypothetical protein